jgi:hypothetical protein
MAEPAYGGAEEGRPPPRSPDPRASGWAAAQQAMAVAAESNVLAVKEALGRPDDDAALEMARLSIRILERLGETIGNLKYGEAMFSEQYDAGYRAGYEACKAERCRLGVIDGGAAPGPR